jgi:hypothetical protein
MLPPVFDVTHFYGIRKEAQFLSDSDPGSLMEKSRIREPGLTSRIRNTA